MKRIIILLFVFNIFGTNVFSAVYFVSVNGNDGNDGLSTENAFLTVSKALSVVQPGDTVYILEGTYDLDNATQISGTEQNPILIKAYENNEVILEGSGNTSTGGRFRLVNDWYVIEGLDFTNGEAGISLTSNASHNIIKNCSAHNCYYTGFYSAAGASYNTFTDCDAYDMYDSGTDGGNADGFGVNGQTSVPGPGNKFINCRAFNNSDDGFDVWKAGYPVEFYNCMSYNNGFNGGDGNGFKLGVNISDNDKHILRNCIAWNNKQNGFDYNDNELSQTLHNCTAYNNGRNYKFDNINGSPVKHDIVNCISAVTQNDDILLQTVIDENINSWNLIDPNSVDIIDENFISIDDNIITGERNPDGSIPESDFLRLKPGSIFIDAGVDTGLPYYGDAPDLGAFESDFSAVKDNYVKDEVFVYPNPYKDYLYICVDNDKLSEVYVYDIEGKEIISKSFFKEIKITNKDLKQGIYVLYVITNNKVFAKKIISSYN
ncbi:MAG: T9SS type A sorting domain-containing protein [Chlorobi bacterium]|nr:T9SS type A sorting domain-containing protein [Chlorobiota bacterium]